MPIALALAAGVLFGVGLLVAGMTHPGRVIGFLDVSGHWDPTLAFVLGAAVAVYAVAYRVIARRRAEPWFDRQFHLPARREVDRALVAGAALFGIGWGLSGLCPGPGLVAGAAGNEAAIVFIITMLLGMVLVARRAR